MLVCTICIAPNFTAAQSCMKQAKTFKIPQKILPSSVKIQFFCNSVFTKCLLLNKCQVLFILGPHYHCVRYLKNTQHLLKFSVLQKWSKNVYLDFTDHNPKHGDNRWLACRYLRKLGTARKWSHVLSPNTNLNLRAVYIIDKNWATHFSWSS